MKKKAFAAFLLAGVLLTATGCGSEGSASSAAEPDLPYGATITLKKQEGEPTVQYDARYIPDAVIEKLLAYYDSIAKQDTALFSSFQLPLYHDYVVDQMLNGEYTDEDLLRNAHNAIVEYYGNKEFDFSMLDITECYRDDEIADRDDAINMLDSLWVQSGGEGSFSADVSETMELIVTRYLTDAGSGENAETASALKDEALFLVNYQGTWYLLYD